jgi:hypothetical protein
MFQKKTYAGDKLVVFKKKVVAKVQEKCKY